MMFSLGGVLLVNIPAEGSARYPGGGRLPRRRSSPHLADYIGAFQNHHRLGMAHQQFVDRRLSTLDADAAKKVDILFI